MSDSAWLKHFIKEDIYSLKNQKVDSPPEKIKSAPQHNVIDSPKKEIAEEESESYGTFHELAIWVPPMSELDQELVHNIIKAIRKKPENIHIMEGLEDYMPNYGIIISFGYHKELEFKIGQKLSLNQPTKFANRTILVTDLPQVLADDKSKKMLLWGALKKIFKI